MLYLLIIRDIIDDLNSVRRTLTTYGAPKMTIHLLDFNQKSQLRIHFHTHTDGCAESQHQTARLIKVSVEFNYIKLERCNTFHLTINSIDIEPELQYECVSFDINDI